MFRMTKLTDYGIVLLSRFASGSGDEALNARVLAEETNLPLPTVGKLLKKLVHGKLLVSHRGTNGGYRLARRPEEINVAEIIGSLEGPIAITECNLVSPGICDHESGCPVRSNLQVISTAISEALANVTLAELTSPMFAHRFSLSSGEPAARLPAHAATRSVH
jgi:FeS assembly SUF system regulator